MRTAMVRLLTKVEYTEEILFVGRGPRMLLSFVKPIGRRPLNLELEPQKRN